jgi:Protein of unknown function (DUF3575)
MKKIILLSASLIILSSSAFAQAFDESLGSFASSIFKKYDSERDGGREGKDQFTSDLGLRNVIKVNLPSLSLSNFSVQFERIISQRATFGLGVRFMPKYKVDLSANIGDLIKDVDSNLSKSSAGLEVNNFAITPELRIYLGRNVGKGFYVAPYARYESFDINMPFSTVLTSGKPVAALLNGKMSGFGFGMLLGAQFNLGKRFTLDVFAGPNVGPRKIIINAESTLFNFTNNEINELNDKLTFETALFKVDAETTTNKIELTSNAGFFIRSGLAFGFRF